MHPHPEPTTREKSGEALWYGLFAAGGMLTALVVPIHVLLNNLAAPLGVVSPEIIGRERMATLVAHPLIKLYLFALIAFALFHWAHRFRYILVDLGVRGARGPIALLAYGAAVVGAVSAAVVLLTVP
ncbi:MAG TPA: fumarate reductase subunit FrdD [Chloroflexota bacterium]|jgi:fumarate reductase subunit D|nr:fumarate reductase subunit FrdD [Chloroflexota bacterium]